MDRLTQWAALSPLEEWSLTTPMIAMVTVAGDHTVFWVNTIAIAFGVLCALGGGCATKPFLEKSVTATVPKKVRLPRRDENGGARELGSLEILLYFASLWLQQYAVAGAWLAFKVAAKWAAWQHIAKIQDKRPDDDEDTYLVLRDRLRFSNNLLGSFLNGTLYNVFCAALGWGVARAIATLGLHYRYELSLWPVSVLWSVAIATGAIVSTGTIWLLFFRRPKNRRDHRRQQPHRQPQVGSRGISMTFAEERALKIYDSMIQVALSGFKLLALLNGGAVVALLAYLGHVAGDEGSALAVVPPDLRWQMGIFAFGLVCCAVAHGLAYRTQFFLWNEAVGTFAQGKHRRWLIAAAIASGLSVLAFAVASFWTAAALR